MRGLTLIAFGLFWALCRFSRIPDFEDVALNEALHVIFAAFCAVGMVSIAEMFRSKTFPRDYKR
ncbi:hypothetical protein [Prosthecochloris sp.]|uniref:hypothetical protein n=1 Tax=Prosthecochloris sp. TaxID=290513 RepID=UPI0025E45102|nr:hypothetical protein [Prosthecochloris sp.]